MSLTTDEESETGFHDPEALQAALQPRTYVNPLPYFAVKGSLFGLESFTNHFSPLHRDILAFRARERPPVQRFVDWMCGVPSLREKS